MLRDLGMCVIIVAVSGGVGVLYNQTRDRPIEWVRRDFAAAQPAPVDSTTTAPGDSGHTASDATSGTTSVTVDEVFDALKNNTAFFIDARELHDYQDGHFRGALHLPSSAIYANIDAVLSVVPDTSSRVIVYCGGGNCEASHNVANALRQDFSFTNVAIYTKGWEEVVASGDRFAGMTETVPHEH